MEPRNRRDLTTTKDQTSEGTIGRRRPADLALHFAQVPATGLVRKPGKGDQHPRYPDGGHDLGESSDADHRPTSDQRPRYATRRQQHGSGQDANGNQPHQRQADRTPSQEETRCQAEGKTIFQAEESRGQPGSGDNVHTIPGRK